MPPATSSISSIGMRQELVQGRVEQPDGHRQPGHDLEQSSMKSWRCIGRILASAWRRPSPVVGQDHLAHRDDALGIEEHVLGAAQADAFGAEIAGDARIERGFGIGAHLHAAHLSAQLHDRRRNRRTAPA